LPDGARFCMACGTSVSVEAPAGQTTRRTVTVLFCDLSRSTAMGETHDPELMRAVVTSYFETVSGVIETHGGTVEKFIGDAVMAVFGITRLHEDDALRAVRAAVAVRRAVDQLNLDLRRDRGLEIAVRLGLETGEVVIGDGSRGTVATGDAVNVAARLEQAAQPSEILVGPGTWALVHAWAQADAVAPLSLKGKAVDTTAWRLRTVSPTDHERS
jgi:class 3 adenylate cyclase